MAAALRAVPAARAAHTVAMAHLSVQGAIHHAGHYTHSYQGGVPPAEFAHLQRALTGHFHTHHTVGRNVTCVPGL